MRNSYFLFTLALFVPFTLAAADTVVTPEPGTIMLLATGLAGMGIALRRRNRNK